MPRPGAKANEMSARLCRCFYTSVGLLLLQASVAACDDGEVTLQPLRAAGGDPGAGSLAQAGTFGAPGGTGGAGSAGEARGGAGDMPWLPPVNPCDEGTELEQQQERELLEAFTEAFDSGRYCPDLEDGQRRMLMLDRELEWRARGSICLPIDSLDWFQIRRTPLWAWVLSDTPSLEDAKEALLGANRANLCEQAERAPFRYVGVGHLYDVWTVFLSPGDPEDMQKP